MEEVVVIVYPAPWGTTVNWMEQMHVHLALLAFTVPVSDFSEHITQL